MATGLASDFKVYQAQFNGGFVERQEQNIDALRGQSNGTIAVRSEFIKGDYEQRSFFKKVANLVSRRDTTSVSAATALKQTQDENVTVKLNRKIGPVDQTYDSWKKVGDSPERLSFVVGVQSADDSMAEKLNSALGACDAALSGETALNFDATDGTMTHTDLSKGLAKFGDRASSIRAWVMHSKVYFDLVAQAIADKVTEVAGVTINTGLVATLNRPVIITDSSDLIATGTPDIYTTLGLVEGAIDLVDSETPSVIAEPVTGLENLVGRFQGEYAYNLGLLGFKWDIANGGANPDSTALNLATNWDKAATADKDLCGIRITSQ